MKDAEDEAFDELAKRQGHWGGGYQAKKAMAADKLQEPEREALKLALEELEGIPFYRKYGVRISNAIKYIQEALAQPAQKLRKPYRIEEDDDTQGYITANPDALTIAYQSGFFDGKEAALAGREWNFCERCGKRTANKITIHTCTPPQENK